MVIQTFFIALSVDHCSLSIVHCLLLFQLGCGAGLPGLLAATQGAKHVVFQDYVSYSKEYNNWVNLIPRLKSAELFNSNF